MRNPFLPPPSPGRLARLDVHEVIRDFPELLPLMHGLGIEPRKDGATAISGLDQLRQGTALLECLSWRSPEAR